MTTRPSAIDRRHQGRRKAFVEHDDPDQFDREMTAAFRGFGVDLDKGNPRSAFQARWTTVDRRDRRGN